MVDLFKQASELERIKDLAEIKEVNRRIDLHFQMIVSNANAWGVDGVFEIVGQWCGWGDERALFLRKGGGGWRPNMSEPSQFFSTRQLSFEYTVAGIKFTGMHGNQNKTNRVTIFSNDTKILGRLPKKTLALASYCHIK